MLIFFSIIHLNLLIIIKNYLFLARQQNMKLIIFYKRFFFKVKLKLCRIKDKFFKFGYKNISNLIKANYNS